MKVEPLRQFAFRDEKILYQVNCKTKRAVLLVRSSLSSFVHKNKNSFVGDQGSNKLVHVATKKGIRYNVPPVPL